MGQPVESPKDYIVLNIARSGEGCTDFDPHAIMVEMNKSLAQSLLAKMDLVKSLHQMDPTVSFLGLKDEDSVFLEEVEDEIRETIYDEEWMHVAVNPKGKLPGKVKNACYLNIRVWDDSLCWRGRPRSMDVDFESGLVAREELAMIIKKS